MRTPSQNFGLAEIRRVRHAGGGRATDFRGATAALEFAAKRRDAPSQCAPSAFKCEKPRKTGALWTFSRRHLVDSPDRSSEPLKVNVMRESNQLQMKHAQKKRRHAGAAEHERAKSIVAPTHEAVGPPVSRETPVRQILERISRVKISFTAERQGCYALSAVVIHLAHIAA